MKQIKLLLLLSLFAFTNFAQITQPVKTNVVTIVSDSEVESDDLTEAIQAPNGIFPERRITGKVVGVQDGDTATILDKHNTQYKFRFNGIDAPELKMDFGNKSKENLSKLIFGKEVMVAYDKVDKYGRFVGTIFVGGMNTNLEQIKAGLAWHYKKYQSEQSEADRKTYAEAETKAREAKIGLWSMPNPLPPWDYRTAKKTAQTTEKANRKYETGAKGRCFYVNSSGNKTYVNKKFCATVNKPANVTGLEVTVTQKTEHKSDSSSRTYIKGSRGGCYYLNDKGNKVYVSDKYLCGN